MKKKTQKMMIIIIILLLWCIFCLLYICMIKNVSFAKSLNHENNLILMLHVHTPILIASFQHFSWYDLFEH